MSNEQQKGSGFVPIGELADTLPGVIPSGRGMSAQARHHFTTLRQVNRLIEISEAEPDASTRRARLSRWNESLDGTDHAIYRIRAWVRDRYADALARSDRRLLEQLAPHLTYLENNADLMHYARLRAVGLPVGRGVTEGACKSVIKMRTNGSSQRWRPTGLEAGPCT